MSKAIMNKIQKWNHDLQMWEYQYFIFATDNRTFVVYDSEYGLKNNQIIFESYNYDECIQFVKSRITE